ncbi:XRE family transcriptional regulator [Flaviflexus ciconiae]|uniref:XRE family transcriptional regulator n=1 Tax=Flaviflexus ciconiae TaxID=2496867 RepID=A0A3S9PZC2_9ACTO|nr:helix-turn-helix transcriptional regulator [Flaviflexus ciconiae]AZQ77636.1 XRE family transcriptional regulator [Flaviflexus ciconiae]
MTIRLTEEQVFEWAVDQALRDEEVLEALVDIRRSREPLGLTQKVVARIMGTDQANISRLETGRADVRRRTLREYAVAIGAEIHYNVQLADGHPCMQGSDTSEYDTNSQFEHNADSLERASDVRRLESLIKETESWQPWTSGTPQKHAGPLGGSR